MPYSYSSALDDIIRGIIRTKKLKYFHEHSEYFQRGMEKEITDKYFVDKKEFKLLLEKLISEGYITRDGFHPFYYYDITYKALYLINHGGFQKQEFMSNVSTVFKFASSLFILLGAVATILISYFEYEKRNDIKNLIPGKTIENSTEGNIQKKPIIP